MLLKNSLPTKKAVNLAISLMMGLNLLSAAPAMAQVKQLHIPAHPPTPHARQTPSYTPDLLLIMANPKSQSDDIKKDFEDVHGTLIGTIGEGQLKCYVLRTESGKLTETEKKLLANKKDFRCISRNYQFKAEFVPNDPSFNNEWHLAAINAPRAWDTTRGAGTTIAVMDTGCQASNTDLSGKTAGGCDATGFWAHLVPLLAGPPSPLSIAAGATIGGSGTTDSHGHGTWVATSCAATADNNINTAGVAPAAQVYPIKIAGSGGTTDDLSIMAGLLNAMAHGKKITNISYGFYPPFGFTNPALHAPLHMYFQFYHDLFGGIIFMSAGNDGAFDPDPPVPYLNIVSAIDNSLSLTNFSNWGTCITFTAPGQGIVVSDRSSNPASVNGTSFSSPIVAGIAALVWSANPALPNIAVESIMKASCFKAGSAPWTPYFGYGMPDAAKAVRMARLGF